VRSRIHARRGDRERAIALGREAVTAVEGSDEDKGHHLESLGEAYRLLGDIRAALEAWTEAEQLYAAKGMTLPAEVLRLRIGDLRRIDD
jgi:tetratricopeptide (TPR) repeat protein